ncbi:MAG TPA: SDR family oxidoreductase [Acetobacteraceae bacterium]|nr:SDR family oxidoreductase [Acetobacteraceae bacterium]
MTFDNRTVVVTGGTGALGRAVVERLLAQGARCVVPYIIARELEDFPFTDTVTLIGPCELTDEAQVAQLYQQAGELWASIHIAGGFEMSMLADTTKAGLMHMLSMNLVTCHLCSRAALGQFGAAGGRIVNIASRPALEPRMGAGMTAYTAAKGAVAAFTQALAGELAPRHILVNAIAPSIIDTPANRAAMPQANHATWPKPAEIAPTITFLASPENKVTTGAIVPVPGGT